MDTTGEIEIDDLFGDPISVYTRRQAIGDGVLVDLTEWASLKTGMIGGFTVPVAVTAAVWAAITGIPPSLRSVQDVRGRAHDVLWLARCAVGRAREGDDRVAFNVHLPVEGEADPTRAYLVAIGPGDEGEPVITIMEPGED